MPQYEHIRVAASMCAHNHYAVDGGAHTGQVTSLLLELGFETVIAFEPGPSFDKLHAKFLGKDNVTLINAALGNANQSVWFGGPRPNVTPKLWYADATRPGTTRMVRFDDIKINHKINIPINLVKLDLESGELNALKGMRNTLLEHRPVVVCETADWVIQHKDGPGRHALFDYMASLGYSIVERFSADTVWAFGVKNAGSNHV